MGLFSKKGKSLKSAASKQSLGASASNTSIHSGNSSLRSPSIPNSSSFTGSRVFGNGGPAGQRTSGGGAVSPAVLLPKTPGQRAAADLASLPRPPDPQLDPAGYLRSLQAVRERCRIVAGKAERNQLAHFDVDMRRFRDVVTFVANIIKRDYDAPFVAAIPPHGRYQHFCVGGRDRIAQLLSTFPEEVDSTERCRRMIDLFLVSVLLDAGAGTQWSYKSVENGRVYRRSEGIAVASLEMFKTGLFSGDRREPFQVDKEGLRGLTVEKLAAGLQSKPGNQMAGVEGRAQLLIRLSDALDKRKDFFGEDGRPGNMIDYLLSHPSTQASSSLIIPLPVLWEVLMTGLAPIWPSSRTAINGTPLGDAWPCSSMPQVSPNHTSPTFSAFPNQSAAVAPWESILPFHKLTQWLAYSLMQPMQSLLRVQFAGAELLTGLPEYRNGGLFIDLGVLTLRPDDAERGLKQYNEHMERTTGGRGVEVAPLFAPGDDVVVEWRGVTVGFLDKLLVEVNQVLRAELAGAELSLPQLLEAGSWKGGREIAEVSRPNTKGPPIIIDSDGTVF